MNINKSIIIPFIEAFFSSWAVLRIGQIPSTSILFLFFFLLFGASFYAINNGLIGKFSNTTFHKSNAILASLFTFFYLAGGMEQIYTGLDNALFRLIVLIPSGLGLFFLFYYVITLIAIVTTNWSVINHTKTPKYLGVLASLFCFLCWLPYLLKNFPGVMTIDSMNQFAQVIGAYAPSNHHPYVHTLLIGALYHIGQIFTDNVSMAISFYTIFQMIFLSSCVGFFIATLGDIKCNKWICIVVVLFYGLVPYNGHYAVTIWKDPVFAGSLLLFLLALLRILWNEKEELFSLKWNYLLYIVSGILVCLLRSNGWYAFLLTMPVCIYVLRKHLKSMVLLHLVILAVVLTIKGPIMDANQVIQPDLVESLSIPAQQISRVIVTGKPITEEQSAFLNKILDTSEIASLYNPYVSDGFKRLVRAGDSQYLTDHFGEFLKVYAEIGIAYPVDYLLAFRDQSIGYWFPLQEGLVGGDEGVIENEFGVTNIPVIGGPLVIKINEILLKLKDVIPGYGMLYSMGAILWLILLSATLASQRENKQLLFLYVPCLAIFFTLVIATPVAKEFRYAYPYIYCLPLYMILPFLRTKK